MVTSRWLSIVGIVGAGLSLTGLLLPLFAPGQGLVVILCETLGVLCLAVYFIANWGRLQSFSSRRSTRLGVNNLLAILLLFGILLMVNFLAVRHGAHWDFSETKHFTLAPQTLRVLGELKKTVTVTVFSHERRSGFRSYRDLLESFTYATPNLTVQFVDPEHQPSLAREYGITKQDTAVFESGTRTLHVTKPTEAELTGALLRVTKDTKKRIAFLDGHGERRIDDRARAGFSLGKEILLTQGYEVTRLSTFGELDGEHDISVLVMAGPRDHLAASEQASLNHYVQSGGKLFLMIDPQTTTGLDLLLAQWGLTLGPGIIVDPQDRLAQGSPTALLVRRFTDHAITHDFTAPVLFPVSQRVTFDQEVRKEWEFTPLAQTSSESWSELNLDNTTPSLDAQEDIPGPFALAAAVQPTSHDPEAFASSPALLVIGNSTFASNAYLKFPGNTDFFLNSMAWLAQEQTLLSLSAKDPALRPFIPNPTQEHMLLALQVFSLPVLLLFAGLTVWRRRRRL